LTLRRFTAMIIFDAQAPCEPAPDLRAGATPPALTSDRRMTVGIIAFLILGLLAGAIAKAVLPGDDPGGIIVTMIIGVVGAFLGGFLGGLLFDVNPVDEFFSLSTWLAAIIGSIILLLIYRAVASKRGARR
jgi:uncharacterized membrane protein YeaQ/YmgE (transglycosylase-associated protein family)